MSQTIELPRVQGPGSGLGGHWRVIVKNDVVITTAAVPGGRAPLLVTEDGVEVLTARPGRLENSEIFPDYWS